VLHGSVRWSLLEEEFDRMNRINRMRAAPRYLQWPEDQEKKLPRRRRDAENRGIISIGELGQGFRRQSTR
jgi:hypothetical protein